MNSEAEEAEETEFYSLLITFGVRAKRTDSPTGDDGQCEQCGGGGAGLPPETAALQEKESSRKPRPLLCGSDQHSIFILFPQSQRQLEKNEPFSNFKEQKFSKDENLFFGTGKQSFLSGF